MPLPEDFGTAFDAPTAPAPAETLQPTAAPLGLPSDFGAAMQDDEPQESPLDMVERNAHLTAGQNSSSYFQDKQVADTLGLGVDLVSRNRETTTADAFKANLIKVLSHAPGTAAFFAEDRYNLWAAKDEAQALAQIEQRWKELLVDPALSLTKQAAKAPFSVLGSLPYNAIAGAAGALDFVETSVGDALGTGSTGAFGAVRDWAAQNSQWITENILQSDLLALSDDIKGKGLYDNPELLLDPEWLTYIVGEAATSLIPQIIAAKMTGGSTLIGSAIGGVQEGGDLYRELLNDGVDPQAAFSWSAFFGTTTMALNKLGLDAILGKGAIEKITSKAVKALISGGTESATEWLEEPFQAFSKGMAEGRPLEDVGAAVMESLKNIDVIPGAFLLGGGTSVVASVAEDRANEEIARAAAYRDKLVETHKAIQATQIQQNDPALMEKFLGVAGLGEDVFIDGELLLQSPDLLQRLGVDQALAEDAALSGRSVRVNTAALWTRLSEQELEGLKDDIRPSPSAMSAREAGSYDPVQALRDIEEAAIDAETVVAEVVAVKDRMRQTLEARGLGEQLDADWELAVRFGRALTPKGGDPTAFVQKLNIAAAVVERRADSQVDQQADTIPLMQDPVASIGININDSTQPFTEQILTGEKTIETRNSDSLRPYVGRRVGIVRTGLGQAQLVGYATVGEPKVYTSEEEFRADEAAHRVAAGSAFDFKGRKYGYPMLDVERVDPRPLASRGIIARSLQQDAAYAGVENEAEVEEAGRLWAEMGTESPYFKRWFGNTPMVDEDGDPIAVYHWSQSPTRFQVFDLKLSKEGFHFGSYGQAMDRMEQVLDGGDGGVLFKTYLRGERMITIEDFEENDPYSVAMQLLEQGVISSEDFRKVQYASDMEKDFAATFGREPKTPQEELADILGDNTIIRYENKHEGGYSGEYSYAVFNPTQIKSATGNRGTFDPADARILYQPELTDRIVNALNSQEGPATSDEVAAPPTLYQVQNLPEWKDKTRAWMQKNGYSQDEISRHMAAIEGQMKIFGALGPVQLEMLPQGAGIAPAKGKISGPIRSNADAIYKITFDASAMCVKRLEAAATAAEVERRLGRPLVASERMALVALFKSAGKQAPCLYCYVEAPRSKRATLMQQAQDVIQGNAKPKSSWSAKTKNALATAQEEYNALGLTEIDPRVVTDPEFAETPEGKELRKRMPKIFAAMELVGAGATANLPKLYEEYNGQILALPQKLLDELNNYAGLRFFSSSDFQAEHVADLMQAFFDMELRRAKSHAYTKVPDYVSIFGPTGQKIQTSIFAKEENGEIVMDDWQGMDWETAKAFREQYPNVGTVLVAGSDAIVAWGLEQDWVDYIIPFHYSGLEKKFYETLGWQDFTATQNEKPIGKGKAKKIRMHETGAVGGITTEQGTRNYLALAMERKLVPVFPAFLFKDGAEPVLDKKGKPVKNQRLAQTKRAVERWKAMVESGEIDWAVINPNYYKVKKDYARTDTPFDPVKAEFNLDHADTVLQAFLRGEAPSAKVDTDIADKLQGMITSAPVGFDIGVDALAKVRQGQTLFQAAWHGSPHRFSKFSLDHMGTGEGAQAYGWGLYFAGKKEVAEWYRTGLSEPKETVTFDASGEVYELTNNGWVSQESGYALDYDSAEALAATMLSQEYSEDSIREMIDSGDGVVVNSTEYTNAVAEEALALIASGDITFKIENGQLYKVEIPEDDVMLHWDRPLSEQPEKVREALGFGSAEEARSYWRSIQDRLDAATADLDMEAMDSYDYLEEYGARADAALTDEERAKEKMAQAFMDNRKGVEFYRNLQVTLGSDKAASEYLNSLGIKGIKYLDGTSRTQGEGSYNYVIFDDQTIQILETFYQQQNSGPRGAYNQLKDGSHLVRLFEQANASTMPHELAHAFLTELRAMAETGVADEAMLNDLQKIEAWLDREAVEGSPEWQSYYEDGLTQGMNEAQARDRATFVLRHEKFSRGFERYLWEGVAPEPELEGVFARFSRWLKRLYEDALAFGVNLDPEIRSVFDRMLKADAEVESKVMELGFTPMTQALAKHLGLGPEDRDYAVRLYSAALEKAESKLAQARNKGLRKLRAEWREQAIEEAKNSPVHQMLYTLRKGRGIDKAEFLALYGEEAAKGLPHGVLREGGLTLNEAAFEHNYDTHEQMVNDLWNYRKPEDIAAEVVEAKTAERDATFQVEDFILDTSEFAAYQELMAKAYDKDGNVLSNKAFRNYARKIVATMPLADAMDVRGFLAAMARHHKAETKALKAGKLADAAKANKKARLNHAYAQEALNVKKRVEKAERMAKRLTKLKAGKIEEGHHKALLQLIQRFGLTKKDYSGLQDVPALADLVKLQDAFGADEEASFSQWLLSGEARNYKDLTSGEFEELQDLMKFLYGTGKEMILPTLKVSGLTMDEVKEKILPQIEALPKRGKRRKEGTWLRKMQDQVQSYLSQNRTILWIIRELDGYTALKGVVGPLEKWLYEPLEAANLKRAELSRQLEKRTRKARAQLLKSATAKANKVSLVDLPVPPAWQRQGRVWDFDACLSVLMNMGNAVNRQRVMDGYNLTEQNLQQILAVFSEQDAQAVQDIWDAMDEILWPEIAGTHKKLRFYTPGKVQAEAFTMPDGTVLRGGYYPLKYDPSADTRAARNQDLDKAVQNPATAMLPKSVASGATKARAASAGGMPVLLRTSVLSGHLDWAVHYASHALVIHDLGRILGDKEIAEAIKTAAGEETFRAANELVKRIANPRAGDLPTFLDKVFGKLTGISAVYSMWMNRFGPLTQPTAIGNYIAAEGGWVKGTATWMKGAAHFMANPAKQWNWLMENNAALKNHFTLIRQQLSNAIGEDFRDIQLGKTKSDRIWTATKETVIRGGIAMYGVMDAVVSVPGWYGSYLRGLDEGMSAEDAVVRANKIMAEYTPMSRDMDKTLFQHTKGMARAWTYMMSYFTKQANTNAGFWKAWRQGTIGTDQFIGQIVAVQILPAVVVSMMYSLLTGDDDDRDNILLDAGLEVAAYPFAGLPFAREGAAWAANLARAGITGDTKKLGRNAFQMPGMMYLQLMQRAGSTTYAMVQDFDDDEKQAKALMSLAELTAASAGLPPVPKIAKEVMRGLDDIDDDEGNILNVLIKPKIRKRD